MNKPELKSWRHLIEKIIDKEYQLFNQVKNKGGRAECQDQKTTFYSMRNAQFASWNQESCESYWQDLLHAEEEGRNLLAEKYGYMMEDTFPEEYIKIKEKLPEVSEEKMVLIRQILEIYLRQTDDFMEKYPAFRKRSRRVHKQRGQRAASIETYLEGELKTYSKRTLSYLLLWIREEEKQGRSTVERLYENMILNAGYESFREVQ